MKDDNVNEFIVRVLYGEKLWFLYRGKKYFLEGRRNDGRADLYLYEMWENGKTYHWEGEPNHFPVEEFLKARIWDGDEFWGGRWDMVWVEDDTYTVKNES